MSKNIHQVYIDNPITTNNAQDLMYFGQSPYGAGNDAAMLFSDFSAQFPAPPAALWVAGSGTGSVEGLNVASNSGDYALAFGQNNTVTGDYAVAFGNATAALSIGSAAFGANSQAGASGNRANYSLAFGNGCLTASSGISDYSLAFGNGSATGQAIASNYSISIGLNCKTGNTGSNSDFAIAIGDTCVANGMHSMAVGDGCTTGAPGTTDHSFAIGSNCQTGVTDSSDFSLAMGDTCLTGFGGTALHSLAFGNNCSTGFSADSNYSLAFGNGCNTNGNYSFALGNGAASADDGCVVWLDSLGTPAFSNSPNQFVLGFAGGYFFTGGSLSLLTAGAGFAVTEGLNCKQGSVQLTTGTVTVMNNTVTSSSRIFLTGQDANTTGSLYVSARVDNTSFDITSSNILDSGFVAYEIFEPSI